MIDFDKVLSRIGEFGPYQWVNVFILSICVATMMPFTSFNIIFMLYVPPKWCIETATLNVTRDIAANLTDQCLVSNIDGGSHESQKCTKWQYDTSEYRETASTKFNLICDKDYINKLIQTLMQVAVAIGALGFAALQDRFGRKPGLFASLVVMGIGGIGLVFSPNPWVFLALRLLVASASIPGWSFPYILALEIVGPSKRTLITSVMIVCFASGSAFLGLIAWLCDHWVVLGLSTSLPFVALFFVIFILDESPRWLLTQGKTKKLRKLCLKISTRNKAPLTKREIRMMLNETQSQLMSIFKLVQNPARIAEIRPTSVSRVTLMNILKVPNMLLKLIIVVLLYIMNAVVYTGLAFNVENLPGNRFLNFSVLALMEIPAGFVLLLILNKLGRIWPMTILMLIGGISAIATSFVPISYPYVVLLFAAGAKFGISGSFGVLCQIAGELFPTPVRGTCQGVASFASSMSVAVMPFIVAASEANKALPMLIMGAVSCVGGALGFFLPETLNMILPESIEDAKMSPVGLIALRDNITFKPFRRAKERDRRKTHSEEMTALKPNAEDGISSE